MPKLILPGSSGYYRKIVPEEAGASRTESSASQRRGSHSRNSTIVSAFVSSSSVFTASSRDVSDGREGGGGQWQYVCTRRLHNHHACKYHVGFIFLSCGLVLCSLVFCWRPVRGSAAHCKITVLCMFWLPIFNCFFSYSCSHSSSLHPHNHDSDHVKLLTFARLLLSRKKWHLNSVWRHLPLRCLRCMRGPRFARIDKACSDDSRRETLLTLLCLLLHWLR